MELEDDEVTLLTLTALEFIDILVSDNPTLLSDPDANHVVVEETTNFIMMQLENIPSFDDENAEDIVQEAKDIFFSCQMPPRSHHCTFTTTHSIEVVSTMEKRLLYLQNLPQPAQRSKEWYEYRWNLITASNAYKAFDSESSKNQLIFEKCKPLQSQEDLPVERVNVNTPMHWGQKYEPVSVLFYEHKFATKVADYGCIQHEVYKFLGASPDGIISEPGANRFGRMLEIKNVVSREINGIPKKEYWIQMQLQMETCDLDECDFLETKFVEYVDEDEFRRDGEYLMTEEGDMKGIIMYFASTNGSPTYLYKPLEMSLREFEEDWEPLQMQMQAAHGRQWIRNLYWKLEEISCVLVLRNRIWFQDNISQLKEIWDIITKERVSGYAHRAPKVRTRCYSAAEEEAVCLLAIDPVTGKVSF